MRRLLLALAATLAMLALAACGGGEDEPDEISPQAAVAEAAGRTAAVSTARVSQTLTAEEIPALSSGPVTIESSGEVDFENKRVRISTDLSSSFAQLGQDVEDAVMEVVVDGAVVYMRYPLLQQIQPGLDPWIRIDLAEAGQEQGIDLEALMQSGQNDPGAMLEQLRAASADFQEVGTETVRGVETTHYRGTVDLRRAADLVPQDLRVRVREATEWIIELTGESEVETEVWVDEDGFVRRVRYAYDRFPLGAGPSGEPQLAPATMTMEYYDFDAEDIEIELPPEEDVTDLDELLGQG